MKNKLEVIASEQISVIASERSERSNLKSGIASSPQPALSEANVAPRNDRIKKWSLSLFILICAVMFCPRFVEAVVSISISGGTWALGTQRAQIESTSLANNWTVTNDSGGVESVNIKVSSTGTWTASTDGTQSAIDKFVLRKDSSAGTIITATDQLLANGLADAGTSSFGLYFKTPISGSEQGAHTLTITLTAVAQVSSVLTSGTSWTVPAGIISVKFWAIGAGGGGAGVTANDNVSGGGGGAGGVCYKTYTVSPGDTITYSLGSAGTAGGAGANGGTGGATTVTAGGVTITANGGAGGLFNTTANAAGGTYSGGDGGATGGTGSGLSTDRGGGGGGGIGGSLANAAAPTTYGASGAQSVDVSGLFAALTAVGGYPTTSPGAAGTRTSQYDVSTNNGSPATGFGCGGGGADYYGGSGGNGLYGGGAGGAAGGYIAHSGGTGGAGVVVLSY